MIDSFDGDPAIFLTPNGGNIEYVGGQPRMDAGGMENAVTISFFTSLGWPGNALDANRPEKQIGSDFENDVNVGAITLQKLLDIEQSGKDALKWMLTIGLADEIEVNATAPNVDRIDINVLITKPDGTTFSTKYELNWIAGILRPVQAKVK